MRPLLLLALLALLPVAARSAERRGLYVDKFASILGDAAREDSLLLYARANSFTALTLYDVHRIDLADTERAESLARFIRRARVEGGLDDIGVAGENASFFTGRIIPYNRSRGNALERFTTLNVEFEYWNSGSTGPGDVYCEDYLAPGGYPCTRAGAFAFFIDQLRTVDSAADANGLACELYVGWFTQKECKSFLPYIDRLLLHAYVTDPDRAFAYTRERLEWLEASGHDVHLVVLFSAENDFLKPWLLANGSALDRAERVWRTAFEAAQEWQHLHPIGAQWFTYGEMPFALPTSDVEPATSMRHCLDLSSVGR